VVAVGVALTLAAPAARAQQPPPAQPTLGDAVRDWWKKVPDPVKAKAKEQILAAMEMAFGGARTAPPPPPPAEPAKMTAKEKAAAEKTRRAEIAKLKKLEAQRKAAEAKAMRAHAAAQRAAVAAAKAKGETPPVVVAPPPPLPTTTLHEVAVPLERRGSSYYVGARLNERQEVSFLYDTGASLSTVNQATLAQLGVPIPPDAPTQRTQTANGTVEQALVVLDTLDVGDVRIAGGFTVSVCEPCADGRKVGLLGLNFSRRFLVTLDEGAKKLRLVPRADLLDHRFDVEPFLAYEGVRGQVRGGSFYVTGTVRNRSPRTAVRVRVAGVLVDSSDKELGRISGAVGTVPAGGTVQFSIHGPARKFDKFYIELESADW
jgi:clan AA aspartic protease (TIGR02281 family)